MNLDLTTGDRVSRVRAAVRECGKRPFTAPLLADMTGVTYFSVIRVLHSLAKWGEVERIPMGDPKSNRWCWRAVEVGDAPE